jgi:hypothetical protein
MSIRETDINQNRSKENQIAASEIAAIQKKETNFLLQKHRI